MRSRETARFASSSKSASRARCLPAASVTGPSPVWISSGPRRRKSISRRDRRYHRSGGANGAIELRTRPQLDREVGEAVHGVLLPFRGWLPGENGGRAEEERGHRGAEGAV